MRRGVRGLSAEGSLGRRLLEGAKSVKLFGEEIAVNARIVNFKGLSSHADRDHLLAWIEKFAPTPEQVFVVHGDSPVTELFAKDLNERGIPAHAPLYEEVYDLSANTMLAKGVVLEPKKVSGGAAAGSPALSGSRTCPNSWRPLSAAAGAVPTRTWPVWPTRSNRSWRTGRIKGAALPAPPPQKGPPETAAPTSYDPKERTTAMPMELDRKALRARVRERMREAQPPFWLVTLAFLLMTTGLSTAGKLSGAAYIALPPGPEDTIPMFLALLIGLLTVVFQFGYQNWALDLYRGREPGYGALLDGFSIAGRLVLMEVYIAVYTTLWALAVMLPACLVIIALLPTMAAFLLLSLALPLAAQVVTAVVSYRYAMAPLPADGPPGAGPLLGHPGERGHDARLEVAAVPAGSDLPGVVRAEPCPQHRGTAPPFSGRRSSPSFKQAYPAGTSCSPPSWSLYVYLLAVLLSVLIQIPVTLWLTPCRTISYAGFYQALTDRPAPPPPVWNGPYDGPYSGPDL